MSDADKSLDVLGAKPLAEAISTLTKASTEGAGAFLSRICLPAAEELGLLLQDKVRAWRARNAVAIAAKAESLLRSLPGHEDRHAHPRIAGAVIEHGSWADEELVQDMWAGLLASSCTPEGRSQENFIFVGILAQLTPSQARILRFACDTATKVKSPSGLVTAQTLQVSVSQIMEIAGTSDVHMLDLEFDHLRGLGLFDFASGMNPEEAVVDIGPTSIALQMHMRASGFIGTPVEFYAV